jgi:flagellar biosynthetic protein FliP
MTASTRSFIRHYLEMVAAMILGMVVLGIPAEGALQAAGTSVSALQDDAPALALLGMAVIMTVPMVGWMAHRGHGRRANSEMAASMFIPTFGVIGLLTSGMVTDFMTLMSLEHVVMLPSMLVAMLLRVDEYTCHPRPAQVQEAIA